MKTLVPTPVLILLTFQLMLRFNGFKKMGERKEREGWSGFDPETASFVGDFNANNTKCLDQRQFVSTYGLR